MAFTLGAAAAGGLAYRRRRRQQTAAALRIGAPHAIVWDGYVRLGGIEQWIQMRGEDRRNPALLILHGGPGWPNAVFTLPLRSWEKHFTLVQWDQRGVGKTRLRSGRPADADMTFDRRVADAIELAEWLRRRLDTRRLVLLAESMGTLIGLPLVRQRPDLFSALVATDLYVSVRENEALKRRLTLERLRRAGSRKGLAALEKLDPNPAGWDLAAWNTNMALAFQTNLPVPNLDRRLLLPLLLTSPLYSLREIAAVLAGFREATARMLPEILAYDARQPGVRFEVPFFLLQGAQDVITLTQPAVDFFAEVEAPAKGMTLIEEAGHFAAFTQPERFLSALLAHVVPVL